MYFIGITHNDKTSILDAKIGNQMCYLSYMQKIGKKLYLGF